MPSSERFSDQLERWLGSEGPKTIGSLITLFGDRGFAVAFTVLMALPALPLPTGGITHLLEIVVMLLALELIVGRRDVWLPRRLRRVELSVAAVQRMTDRLLPRIRRIERFAKPRLAVLLRQRVSDALFGALVLVLTVTAFLAPPFTGLDTLPSLGVVLLSLGVLFEDILLAIAGLLVGAAGVLAVLVLGRATFELLS